MKKTVIILFCCLFMLFLFTACDEKKITDGEYTIEVTLSGGSGRASVESPAKIIVDGEKITAIIIWSSPFYEYMIVDDITYYPIGKNGNSTFEIPVVIDKDMAVSASTISMSEPHLVDYILHFDSKTVKGE